MNVRFEAAAPKIIVIAEAELSRWIAEDRPSDGSSGVRSQLDNIFSKAAEEQGGSGPKSIPRLLQTKFKDR
jgi:hypothetical protein